MRMLEETGKIPNHRNMDLMLDEDTAPLAPPDQGE
jgi:hypothetical protein